jgi:DNA-binding transcriptional regulator YiaG
MFVGRVEEAVRSAILGAVRRECRASHASLAAEVRRIKQQLSRLEAEVGTLRGRWEKPAPPRAEGRLARASEEAARRARLTPEAIKRLRARLGLTQVQLAALLGVTGPAVAQWEMGTSEPRGSNRAALVALRKFGRREVRRMLAASGMSPRPRGRLRDS